MSPRTEDQFAEIRDERRRQIFDAAVALFADNGYTATKISDISEAAGVSHGLVYHYFKSKDDLFYAIVEQSLEGTGSIVNAALDRPGEAWERIRWLTQTIIEAMRKRPEPFYLVLQALMLKAVPQAVKELVLREAPNLIRPIADLLEAGQAEGAVADGDPMQHAVAYLALIQGLMLMQAQGIRSTVESDVDTALRLLKG